MKKTKKKNIQSVHSLRNSLLYSLVFLSTSCILGKKKQVVVVPSVRSESLSNSEKYFDSKNDKKYVALLKKKNVKNDNSITDRKSVLLTASNQATKNIRKQHLQKTTPDIRDKTTQFRIKRNKVIPLKNNVLEDTIKIILPNNIVKLPPNNIVKLPPNLNQNQEQNHNNKEQLVHISKNNNSLEKENYLMNANNSLSNENSILIEIEFTEVKNKITLVEGLLKKLEKSRKFNHKTLQKKEKEKYKEIIKYCNQSPIVLKNLHTKFESLTRPSVNKEQLSHKEKLKKGFIDSHRPVLDSYIEFLNFLINSIEK